MAKNEYQVDFEFEVVALSLSTQASLLSGHWTEDNAKFIYLMIIYSINGYKKKIIITIQYIGIYQSHSPVNQRLGVREGVRGTTT